MAPRPRIQISQTLRLELNTSLQTSIGLLRTDAAGLSRYLEEQAAQNPHLRLTPPAPAPGDWLPRWSGVFTAAGGGADTDYLPAAGPSLAAHVIAEIEGMRLPPRARRVAEALADALEPSGWLGRPLTVIADEAAAALAEVEAVLKRLQQIEPRGLFARDLAECLALQAQEMGALDGAMQVVLGNLPLLASGQTARLARLAGCDEAGVLARFRLIRGMNPKPGASFAGPGAAAPPPREPDLLARARPEGGWEISLNRSSLPTIEVRRAEAGDAAQLAAARALHQAVKARNATLLRVGREIAARQEAALNDGAAALEPMTMADLAEALGLHESTISRVVAGTCLDTPRGAWWLRRMFSSARQGSGGVTSAAALRHRLLGLVAGEDPQRPLSDAALARALLAETGVDLPRRTAAQYRAEAGIPPAHRRRRR